MKKTKVKNKIWLNNAVTYGMVIAAYIFVQLMLKGDHMSSLMKGLLVPHSIMAVSLNLVVGISGELSLGHAGFMCVGAFSGALFSKCMSETIGNSIVTFIIAALIGAAAAALFGLIIGIPVLRLRGDYLAIVTLAFGEIIKNLVNVIYLGRDAEGFHLSFKATPKLGEGTPRLSTITIGVILLIITLFIVQNLVNSRTGRAVMAIRDNRIAAQSIGLSVTKYKLLAFTISAALAGVGGVLYAHNLTTLTALPKNFGYNQSIMFLVFVVLGGIGNIRGSIIAAVVLTVLPEMLRGLNNYRMLIYAIVLILMMLFNSAPQMIVLRERIFGKFRKSAETKEAI